MQCHVAHTHKPAGWGLISSLKRMAVLTFASLGLLAGTSRAAESTLVNYSTASLSGSIPTYQDTTRSLSINSGTEARIDFDTSTPLFSAYAPLKGGLHMLNPANTGTYSLWRIHTDVNSWPNKATTFCASNSSDANPCTVNVVYVWNKADFTGVGTNTVTFDSGSTLNLNITDWSGTGPQIRFVVCNGTQYYVSEAVATATGAFSLTNFNNNGAAGYRWAPVTLTATSFDLPGTLTYSAVNFTDVQKVGWIGKSVDGYFRQWGFSTFSAAGVIGAPPAPPTNLTATAGNAQVSLAWTGSTGATSYNVYRGTSAGGESPTPIATGVSTTSYTNTGLTNGTTYYYKVAAVNSSGTSGYSNEASATPVAPTQSTLINYVTSSLSGAIPTYQDTARSLSINSASEARINFDTSAALFAGYAPLKGGVHMVNPSGTGTYSMWRLHTDPNSWPNKATTFFASNSSNASVCTVNVVYLWNKADFAGAGSNPVSFNSSSALNLNVQDWTGGTIRFLVCNGTQYYVSQASLGGPGALSLTNFNNNNANGYRWAPVTLTATSFDLPGTLTFSAVNFTDVQKIGWIGTGSSGYFRQWGFDTFSATGVIGGGSAPPAPTGLSASAGNAQVSLAWNASSGATSYNVYRGTTSNGESPTPIATGVASTNYTNTGLTNGTTYYYKVAAVNGYGTSGYSNEASATPVAASQHMIGINFEGISDWQVAQTFADLTKQARTWGPPSAPWNADATIAGTDGWPTKDFGAVFMDYSQNITGVYKLSFTGTATIAPTGGSSLTITNQTVVNNVTTADVTLNSGSSLMLAFTSTKRTSTSPAGTGLTNLKLIRPGYTTSDTFTTFMDSLMTRFTTVRFLDFLSVNNSTVVNWSDRTNGLYGNPCGKGTGMPLEYAVMLCNKYNKDMYVLVPHKASDDYVTKLAQLIRYGSDGNLPYTSTQASPVFPPLNSNLNVYVEWSNEVWNGQFTQFNDNLNAAINAVVGSTAEGQVLNYDNLDLSKDANGNYNNRYTWCERRVAYQAVRVSNIFRSVFGDAAMMSRVRPVLMSQFSYTAAFLHNGLAFMDAYYNNGDGQTHVATPRTVNYYIYGGGGASYVWLEGQDPATVDALYNTVLPSVWPAQQRYMADDANYAKAFGYHRISYEGGNHWNNTGTNDQVKTDARWDARYKNFMLTDFDYWDKSGGELYIYYASSGSHNWTWSLVDSRLNFASYPGVQAIDQLNSTAPAAANIGTAVPANIDANQWSINFNGWGTPGAGSVNMNLGNWYGYTFRNTTAGTWRFWLSAYSAAGGSTADVYVDGNKIGSITIPVGGSPVDSASVSTTLSAGLHAVRILDKAGSYTVAQVKISQ